MVKLFPVQLVAQWWQSDRCFVAAKEKAILTISADMAYGGRPLFSFFDVDDPPHSHSALKHADNKYQGACTVLSLPKSQKLSSQ